MTRIAAGKNRLADKIQQDIQHLCREMGNRHVGSPGNREATAFFASRMRQNGWVTESPEFDCIDWERGEVHLQAGATTFWADVSPYSRPCHLSAPLVVASTYNFLEKNDIAGKILLLRGELAKEQLIPKNFPFYIPVTYPDLVALLETKQPAAIIAATELNPELAGAVYPFPLIEDGDFNIPSVFTTANEGTRLGKFIGQEITLQFESHRIPARGCNVVARKQPEIADKLVFCAHIDTKKGTPGALDNASGVVTLLALAELLTDYSGQFGIEIVALNGEDYYAVPGQKLYLESNTAPKAAATTAAATMAQVQLAVNLDLAGFRGRDTIFSFFDCPTRFLAPLRRLLAQRSKMHEGPLWYQSDHAIFLSRQRPAVAITSENFMQLAAEITHTEKDVPELLDCGILANIAWLLRDFILEVSAS